VSASGPVEDFINRWSSVGGSERANYQLFITELCALLDVPLPQPARDDADDNAYVFERRVTFAHGDGQQSFGFIDCYRRGAFVLEAKKLKAASHTRGFDEALLRARSQAEGYARALPAAEGRPPFVVVVDVGRPKADFIVGNPPFIGKLKMREALGDGYVEALRSVWKQVPDSADFVMYWWEQAADHVRGRNCRRFGLITTNSIAMVFNRRVVERHLSGTPPLCLAMAHQAIHERL